MRNDQTSEVSITIHPFENLTGRNDLDIFCRSFYIDVLTGFSRYREFKIVPHELIRESVINPEYSFNGAFQYQKGHLKFNAQLINNEQNSVTWADGHVIEGNDIISIQEDLLKQVINTLRLHVNHDLMQQIRKKSPSTLSVYEHWLCGMEELRKGTFSADEKARQHFEKAMEIDTTYSLAYSGMSMSYFNEWSCQLWDRWDDSQRGAYNWAKKAIELDEQNYIAALVLGRIYVYEAEYDIGEHYLRKALRLNPNDVDVMMQLATCFVYLDKLDEAQKFYDDANSIQDNVDQYAHIGALIALERGEFRKALDLGKIAVAPWVDFAPMMAAASFEIGDMENMHRFWNFFLNDFQKKIQHGSPIDSNNQPVNWLIGISPYKNGTRLSRFWEFISNKKISLSSRTFYKVGDPETRNIFVRQNELWQISFDGTTFHMKDAKGLHDLEKMLREPGKEFHCTELMGTSGQSDPVLAFDEKAKRSYQKRILDLQEEIQVAERNNDFTKSAELQKEYDDVIDHLKASIGLKGKKRTVNDPIEKIRSAVTWRIRSAISRIEGYDPALAKHLSLSVKTGTFCCYNPEKPIHWLID